MKRIHTEGEAKIVEYGNLSELFTQLAKPAVRGRRDASDDGDSYFTGTQSYDEAYDMMLSGDTKSYAKLLKLKTETDKHYIKESKGRIKTYNHVVGYTPNVPNAVMGLPNSMINAERVPKKHKVVDIFVNRSRSAGTGTSQIEYEGALILSFIDALERDGYRVSLYAGKVSWNSNVNAPQGFMAPIKRATEPLNIKKVAFYLIHPSFLRRIAFRIDETEDKLDDITHDGYGSVRNREKMRQFIHSTIDERFVIVDDGLHLDEDDETENNIEKLNKLFKTR